MHIAPDANERVWPTIQVPMPKWKVLVINLIGLVECSVEKPDLNVDRVTDPLEYATYTLNRKQVKDTAPSDSPAMGKP